MKISFQPNGNLISGIHELTINEIEEYYGYNHHRQELISGLKLLILHLSDCGCETIYLDGSFVSKKEFPNDFDACWDEHFVDLQKLKDKYSTILNFKESRKYQKAMYGGDFFPMSSSATPPPLYNTFFDFFQKDKENTPKGIVKINLK